MLSAVAVFVFVCGSLIRFRFRNKITELIAFAFLVRILALQAGLLMAGLDETLVLTLLLTNAYLPAIHAVHTWITVLLCPVCLNGMPDLFKALEIGEGSYFISGGIWLEEECFQAIDTDQNF